MNQTQLTHTPVSPTKEPLAAGRPLGPAPGSGAARVDPGRSSASPALTLSYPDSAHPGGRTSQPPTQSASRRDRDPNPHSNLDSNLDPNLGLATELEGEKARIRLLYEEVERRGFASGLAAGRAQQRKERLAQAKQIRTAVQALRQTSSRLLRSFEPEIVALSLEIARKVLGHEAQIDRLFLAGAVRHALEGLHPAAQAVLLVAPGDESIWQAWLTDLEADRSELARQVRVESDPTVGAGMCLCRSGPSLLDLSVPAQMGEISRRFMELLESSDAAPASESEGA